MTNPICNFPSIASYLNVDCTPAADSAAQQEGAEEIAQDAAGEAQPLEVPQLKFEAPEPPKVGLIIETRQVPQLHGEEARMIRGLDKLASDPDTQKLLQDLVDHPEKWVDLRQSILDRLKDK